MDDRAGRDHLPRAYWQVTAAVLPSNLRHRRSGRVGASGRAGTGHGRADHPKRWHLGVIVPSQPVGLLSHVSLAVVRLVSPDIAGGCVQAHYALLLELCVEHRCRQDLPRQIKITDNLV
jgi:hypothetical protein